MPRPAPSLPDCCAGACFVCLLATGRPQAHRNYSIVFLNAATHGVVLGWLETNGTLRPMAVLAPGERRKIATQTGDV